MKKLALLVLLGLVAFTPSAVAQQLKPAMRCVDLGVKIDGLAMSSSRAFSINRENTMGQNELLVLWQKLTDANTSITRLDTTCTFSKDGSTTDYTPQLCTVASGVCTADDTLIFRKSSPGTKNFVYRADISGSPDIECTYSVGTGSGGAPDLLTVEVWLCTF